MNNENEVMEKAPVLTKKDCVKGAIRAPAIETIFPHAGFFPHGPPGSRKNQAAGTRRTRNL